MFGDVCPHCSNETTTRPFTKVEKNPKTKLFEPKGLGRHTTILGQWCNNHPIGSTGWVENMHYCPSRWGSYRGGIKIPISKQKAVKKRVVEVVVKKKTAPLKKKNVGKK
jgi:hypothetical protein